MLRNNRAAFLILIVGLWLAAIAYWTKGFGYLIDGPGGQGAIDLRLRWVDQQYVLHRQNPFDVYFAKHSVPNLNAQRQGRDTSMMRQIGPPESVGYPGWSFFSGYLLFSLPWRATRLYYSAIQLACLLWLVRWAFLQGRQISPRCGAFCAAGIAALASFCTTLANGQYGILVLTLLALSMQLDEAGYPMCAGLLLGIACLKPNITGPFLLCFLARREWRTIGAAIVYLSIASLWVWGAIHTNPIETLEQMMHAGERFAQTGYGPLSLAIRLGMPPHIATPMIAVGVAALTLWICLLYRRRPLLELFAVAGVAARFWTYHQTYDNLSVVFLLIALARIAWERERLTTASWLAAVALSLWLPAKLTDVVWFQVIQCSVWIGGVVVMLRWGGKQKIEETGAIASSPVVQSA